MDSMDIAEQLKEMRQDNADRETWEKRVAIYISVLAVLLAITSLGGSNATKDTLTNAIAASDTYAFYQSKSIRQVAYRIAADELEILETVEGILTPNGREKLGNLVGKFRDMANRYESEPEKGEGKKELLAKAKELEAKRDFSSTQDPYFDLAEAGLQIAVVLASVSLVAESAILLWVSGSLATVASLMMINGYLLLVNIF